mmetsp:Transcript_39502/g.51708  ORF Transcript_39502/g.51708 Transcript_39502/m.51708 type:complete len:107 (+) Transcript_39502:451-771(+)
MDAIYSEDASEEDAELTISTFSAFLERLNIRWVDGRKHIAGNNLSPADFNLLAFYTSMVTNKGLYKSQIAQKLTEKVNELDNVRRVIESIRDPLSGAIDKLGVTVY